MDNDSAQQYRKIANCLQRDRKVRALPAHIQQGWTLLLMSPRLWSMGVYTGTASSLATEGFRWLSVEQMTDALDVLQRAGLVLVDDANSLIWNYLRYNPAYSPNHVRSWGSIIRRELAECPLRDALVSAIEGHATERGELFRRAFVSSFAGLLLRSEAPPEVLPPAPPEAPPEGLPEGLRDTQITDHNRSTDGSQNTVRACARAHSEAPPEGLARTDTHTDTDERRASRSDTRSPKDVRKDGALPTRRRRPWIAFEALRIALSVPQDLHDEFLSAMATPDERALLRFYADTEARYDEQTVGEGPFKFWRREFAAWQGTSSPVTAPAEDPAKRAARLTLLRRSRMATS
jgi:hypothetical protein